VVEAWGALVHLSEIYRGMVQFMILQGVGLLLVFFFPQLTTWPPKPLFGDEAKI
jgi:TRAP-type mannitol/chloroaromatic compound transport system permease large subunit